MCYYDEQRAGNNSANHPADLPGLSFRLPKLIPPKAQAKTPMLCAVLAVGLFLDLLALEVARLRRNGSVASLVSAYIGMIVLFQLLLPALPCCLRFIHR